METVADYTLVQRWEALKAEKPQLRIRDAATALGVSEAELLATRLGDGVTRLEGDFSDVLKEVGSLGHVMALTRNDNVVHERKGEYKDISFSPHAGLVLGEDIDLRLFMSHWTFAFAVNENNRQSLQFFDKSGTAIHKIYLTETSNEDAYNALVAKYTAKVQNSLLHTVVYPAEAPELADAEIDIAAFQAEWRATKDTHEFFGLLRKHKVSRTQAMRLGPPELLTKVANDAVRKALQAASDKQVPVMIFVGNKGCIQIHTGKVDRLLEQGPWYNVMDPKFNLHLKETSIAESWVVKKPTSDGIVTALEIYDEKGENIALFFGKRKPGNPEDEAWRQIVADLV